MTPCLGAFFTIAEQATFLPDLMSFGDFRTNSSSYSSQTFVFMLLALHMP
jgi:hypothetical protein